MCQLNIKYFRQQSQSGDTQINVQKQSGLFKCASWDKFGINFGNRIWDKCGIKFISLFVAR